MDIWSHKTAIPPIQARNNAKEASITLWLNDGPGSDSLIGMFQELGPSKITANLTSQVNPYAWNEVVLWYDIRHPFNDPEPPNYFVEYLNLPSTQNALGVDLNYTRSSKDVYFEFQQTGDFVYPNFKEDIEMLLNNGVRVARFYSDADYICNWYQFVLVHER